MLLSSRDVRINLYPETLFEIMGITFIPNFECPYLLGVEGMLTPIKVASTLYGIHSVVWKSLSTLRSVGTVVQSFSFNACRFNFPHDPEIQDLLMDCSYFLPDY